MDIEKNELVWMFGIGANMNVEKLEAQKGTKVVDHCPAKVFDWEMQFTAPISKYIEPAMASAHPKEGSEVHGLAFAVSKEDAARIDEKEQVGRELLVTQVQIHLYDGRKVYG